MSDPSVDPTSGPAPDPAPGRTRRRWVPRALTAVALVAVGALVGATTALATHSFSDVPPTNPFHDDIAWLAENGIADGYADGTFHPGDPLSRQAAAAMLRRVAGADPAVPPVATAGSLDVQRFSGTNATITATSYQSAQTVVPMDLGAPGTYLLLVTAELSTTHNEASLSCSPKSTGVVQLSQFGADLAGTQYRANATGVWIVDEGAGPMEVACYKYAVSGTGDATVAIPSVVAIRLAGT